MNQQITWKPVNHPDILFGYLVSPEGYIKAEGIDDKDAITSPSYHSTNGYDFMLLNNKDGKVQLFPIDDIIAYAYIPIPSSLKGKKAKVSHINGDTRDISLDNLQWVEDIEEWRVCTYPGVKPNMYEVSSRGRVRNKKTGRPMSSTHHQGYIDTTVNTQSGWKSIRQHRLVAWEFCNHDTDFMSKQVNHIDGIKTHNYPKNLEVVTVSENVKHAFDVGLAIGKCCENSPHTTLRNSDVEKICELLIKYDGDEKEVINILKGCGIDISESFIRHLKYKDCWTEVSDRYFESTRFRKRSYKKYITEKDVIVIIECLIKHRGEQKISKVVYDELSNTIQALTKGMIEKIMYKYSWKAISDRYFDKDFFK